MSHVVYGIAALILATFFAVKTAHYLIAAGIAQRDAEFADTAKEHEAHSSAFFVLSMIGFACLFLTMASGAAAGAFFHS